MSDRWAVVANPTKLEGSERALIGEVAAKAGWPAPQWFETTPDDPGYGVAKQALADGADLVAALGGDGTVRCVAAALAGSGVPLGLLPAGTGNLLARNLDLPVDDLTEALQVLFAGGRRSIDTGRFVPLEGADDEGDDEAAQTFVVMAGVGMDAQVMGDAPEGLKKRVGWAAYLVSGARSLMDNGFRASLCSDGVISDQRQVRTVLVGNCGTLTAGMELIPEAQVDDGAVDLVALSPRGVLSWLSMAVHIVTMRRRGHSAVTRSRAAAFAVRTDRLVGYELDGDALGECYGYRTWTEAGALVVCVG